MKPKRGNPQMVKGAPSVNPLGRAAKSFSRASTPGPSKPAGSDGVIAPGGYLFSGERNHKLIGDQRWVTYDNLVANVAIVASAVRVWLDLAGAAKWSVQPNPAGGANAERMAEILEDALVENRTLSKPWRNIVKRQMMKKFRGFALHEAIVKRRADGVVVFADIQHRPQWTIQRWDKPDEQSNWQAIEQRTRSGNVYVIPRARLFYSVEDALTDSPDGVGLFRHLVEIQRVLERYTQLEGIGFDTDLAGVPLARAPLQELAKEALDSGIDRTDSAAIAAYVRARIAPLADLIEKRVVTSDRSLLLDSLPYFSTDVDGSESPSATYKWSVDTIRTQITAMPELAAAIARCNTEIARVMYADWLLLGSGEATGAYAMTESKMEMFSLAVNAALDDVADDATRDLATRLTLLNGFDPDTETPTLQHEPIAKQSVEAAARTLVLLSQAALRPGDEAADILRARMDLPGVPELDLGDAMLPSARRGAMPDGAPEEIDPVDE